MFNMLSLGCITQNTLINPQAKGLLMSGLKYCGEKVIIDPQSWKNTEPRRGFIFSGETGSTHFSLNGFLKLYLDS